jgi:hypothetical protein
VSITNYKLQRILIRFRGKELRILRIEMLQRAALRAKDKDTNFHDPRLEEKVKLQANCELRTANREPR